MELIILLVIGKFSLWRAVRRRVFRRRRIKRTKQPFCILEEFHTDFMKLRWKVCFAYFSYTGLSILCFSDSVKSAFAAFFQQFGAVKRLRIARNRKVSFFFVFELQICFGLGRFDCLAAVCYVVILVDCAC